MERRSFIRLLGGGAVLAASTVAGVACTSDIPNEAIAPWQPPAPVTPGTDVRRWILAHAILAPHSHNLQSWLVDLRRDGEITLYCDRTRLLPQTDPLSRQIMMSQGTFLELLAMAAQQLGWHAEIELFPQGTFDPQAQTGHGMTARIRLAPDERLKPDPLFAQVFRRRTNRQAYAPQFPAADALQAIAAATQASAFAAPLRVGFSGPQDAHWAQQRAIARDAWRIELQTPRTVLESYRVLRIGPEEIARHRGGISVNERLPRVLSKLGLLDRQQAPGPNDVATTSQIKEFDAKIEATPAFFWMVTEDNQRRTQVQAGRAYVRAQLAATAHGLSMHPLQQALQEYPEQAVPYAAIHGLLGATRPGQTVQMWARLGSAPPVGPAPRRGVDAHLMPA